MTRINVVDVTLLSNAHLIAEYKEITRPFNKVLNRINKKGLDDCISDCKISLSYTLNKGHETFFFNKLKYLYNRYISLFNEMIRRGFSPNKRLYNEIRYRFYSQLSSTNLWNDYKPTQEDTYLNMARLVKRSKMDHVIDELNA